MLISKPSSAEVFGHFPSKFLNMNPYRLHMSYRDKNWGLGVPKGVFWWKQKFLFFSTFFIWAWIFSISGMDIIDFSKNLENLG